MSCFPVGWVDYQNGLTGLHCGRELPPPFIKDGQPPVGLNVFWMDGEDMEEGLFRLLNVALLKIDLGTKVPSRDVVGMVRQPQIENIGRIIRHTLLDIGICQTNKTPRSGVFFQLPLEVINLA